MDNNLEIELERARLTNYILKKENELLLGKIGNIANEKRELLQKIEKKEQSVTYRVKRKLKNRMKKIIGRK